MDSWKTVGDLSVESIEQFVADAAAAGQAVHIGTDSLATGKTTTFVTVVAVLTPSKGGRAAYRKEVVPRISSLRERLLKETWKSVELGLQLSHVVPGELTIHVDANPEERYPSSRYVQELVGLVVGQGFKALIKPDSWTATHVADHVARSISKPQRPASPSDRRTAATRA